MFCSKCGSPVADDARFCPQCSAPTSAAASGPGVGDKFKGASKDALQAFLRFAVSPVGGLAPACESLRGKQSMAVGIVFGVVFIVCVLLGGLFLIRFHLGWLTAGAIIKAIVAPVMPFIGIVAVSLGARKITRSAGSLDSDCFIAGASLLPMGLLFLLGGILGIGNFEVTGIVGVFAGCTSVLMLFAGCTRISKMSDLVATLTIPVMILLGAWLMKILMFSGMSGPGPMMPPTYPSGYPPSFPM